MAIFNIDYFNTLDRGYYSAQTMKDAKEAGTFVDFPQDAGPGTKLTAKEIGTTMAPDTYPLQELQAKIRTGAARLEIGFAGAGKSGFGGRGATPEILGKLEREQFRELQKVSDVKVTTHATFGKQGLSGLTQQGFSEDEAQKTLKEINKAIDFAATATRGGAVVFHAGEWQRPIMDAGEKNPDKTSARERVFSEYENEYQKAPIFLADERTGQIMALNRDMKFYFPKEKRDPKTGMIYVETAQDGTPIIEEMDYGHALGHIKQRYKDKPEMQGKSDAEILLYGYREQQLKEAKGTALRYTENLDSFKKKLEYVQDQLKLQEKMWNNTSEEDRWKLQEKDPNIPTIYRPVKDILAEEEKNLRHQIEGVQTTAAAAQEQYKKIEEEQKRFKPIEEVGIKRTADTLAKAGIKAMITSDQHKKDLTEPIFIAPENVFPEFYGSHADEMIRIIQDSRKTMADKLKRQGYSAEDAKKKAETHIRATLDTGHLNNWRQHFQAKTDENGKVLENPEQVDKRFKKWYLEQVQKMVDKKVLGHIHLTDNWGYDDEHITPGQGNTPTKEAVKILEEAGFKDFIAEVGSFNSNTVLQDTLAELGSPVYALDKKMTFGKLRHGHFGYNAPPNYIVGGYAPSNDFRLWSEVPLE